MTGRRKRVAIDFLVAIYRLGLVLLPARFRHGFGQDMAQLLRDQLVESGPRLLCVAVAAYLDLGRQAVLERLENPNIPNIHGAGFVRSRRKGRGSMERFFKETFDAARSLMRQPLLSLTIILIMALGIGLDTALYSALRATLVRPLPFEGAENVRVLTANYAGATRWSFGVPELRDIESRLPQLGPIGIYSTSWSVGRTGSGFPVQLEAGVASSAFFDVLDAPFHLGRGFLPEDDDDLDAHPVVIMGYEFWRRELGADPDALGQDFELDGRRLTVVGVLGEGFNFADQDLWLPLSEGGRFFGRRFYEARRARFHYGVIRLPAEPGSDPRLVEEKIDRVMAELALQYPVEQEGRTAEVEDLRTFFFGSVETPIRLLFAGALAVLLLCTVNVGALVVARALSRRRELAVRMAVGASRGQIAWRLIVEGLLLSTAGGVLGVLAAHGALASLTSGSLARLADFGLPAFTRLELDGGVLALAVATTALVGIALGALPAFARDLRDPVTALRGGGRAGSDRRIQTRRTWILTFETAMALVLLVGASLLGKSLLNLQTADLGMDSRDLLTAQLHLRGPQFQAEDWQESIAKKYRLAAAVDKRLEAVPGVRSATLWGPAMLGAANRHIMLTPGGLDPEDEKNQLFCQFLAVDSGGLRELGIELASGREFDSRDQSGGHRVALIDESMARSVFAQKDPMGRRLLFGTQEDQFVTVVGVVRDTRHRGRRNNDRDDGVVGDIYLPFSQWATDLPTLALRLEPGVSSEAMIESVRLAVSEVDASVPVADFATLEQRLARSASMPRLSATLMGVYALITALLAIVGTYALLAHAVRERRQEIAVRSALGAGRWALQFLMLRLGLLPVVVGAAIGLAFAILLSRVLKSMLYEVSPTDPLSYGAAAALVLGAAAAAAFMPSRRASRTEPASVLRDD